MTDPAPHKRIKPKQRVAHGDYPFSRCAPSIAVLAGYLGLPWKADHDTLRPFSGIRGWFDKIPHHHPRLHAVALLKLKTVTIGGAKGIPAILPRCKTLTPCGPEKQNYQ